MESDSAARRMAERYKRMEAQYDETVLTRKIYTKGSETLQDWVKSLWYR